MSQILCTFPGRAGDILWALPTVRALSERHGTPVDLQIAGEFAAMVPLLERQPYLRQVFADHRWALSPEQAWQAPPAPAEYDTTYQLGYRRWPELPLPLETASHLSVIPDLDRPWITLPGQPWLPRPVVCGFTEAWFELKVGLVTILARRALVANGIAGMALYNLSVPGGRWQEEAAGLSIATSWLDTAYMIAASRVIVADCSALHVLACALGTPVILVEPMEARWNPIFYPYGMNGPQVTVVKGNDGRPTFDARATWDVLARMLSLDGVEPVKVVL